MFIKNCFLIALTVLVGSSIQAQAGQDPKRAHRCVVMPAGGGYPVPQPNYAPPSALELETHTLTFEDGFDPVDGPYYKGAQLFFPELVVRSMSPTHSWVEVNIPSFDYGPPPALAKMRVVVSAYGGGRFDKYWRCMVEGLNDGDLVHIINPSDAHAPLRVSVSAYWELASWGPQPLTLPFQTKYFALVGDTFSIPVR